MVPMNKVWEQVFVDTWNECGIFEENEINAWQSKNPLLTEARTCARIEAYVKLAENLADRAYFMTLEYRQNHLNALWKKSKTYKNFKALDNILLDCYWHVTYAMSLLEIIASWP